jgi:predicted Holliday junction resolvase-like endonuclease
MSVLRHWKIVVVLLGIVLLSGYVGARFGYQKAKRDFREKRNPEQWNERAMKSLDKDLKLTPEQHQKIQKLIDESVDELKVVREETVAKSKEIVQKLVTDVDNELTAEQKEKFSNMKPKDSELTIDILKVEPRKK